MSEWIAIRRDHLEAVFKRWMALETDQGVRYRGLIKPIPELVEARKHIENILGKKP